MRRIIRARQRRIAPGASRMTKQPWATSHTGSVRTSRAQNHAPAYLRRGIQILHTSPRERGQLIVVMVDTLLGPCMMDGWKGLPAKGKTTDLGSWEWGTGHGREAALLSTNMHACKWKSPLRESGSWVGNITVSSFSLDTPSVPSNHSSAPCETVRQHVLKHDTGEPWKATRN